MPGFCFLASCIPGSIVALFFGSLSAFGSVEEASCSVVIRAVVVSFVGSLVKVVIISSVEDEAVKDKINKIATGNVVYLEDCTYRSYGTTARDPGQSVC